MRTSSYSYLTLLEDLVGDADSVLDVGCGSNSPLGRFRRRVPLTVGVDLHGRGDTQHSQISGWPGEQRGNARARLVDAAFGQLQLSAPSYVVDEAGGVSAVITVISRRRSSKSPSGTISARPRTYPSCANVTTSPAAPLLTPK